MQPDRVLLLDAFSLVVVFLGSTVDAWQRAGYHENPDHADFRRGALLRTHAPGLCDVASMKPFGTPQVVSLSPEDRGTPPAAVCGKSCL
jgi:protein transport protein SEC23